MIGVKISYAKQIKTATGLVDLKQSSGTIIDKRDGVFSTSYLVVDENGNTEVVQMTEVKKIHILETKKLDTAP